MKILTTWVNRIIAATALSLLLCTADSAISAEKWQGIDESVVEKIAGEHGRKAKKPLIEAEGDLQLFIFLVAGAAGGFVAGYYWRVLLEGKKK